MPDENPILRHWQTEWQVFYENLLLLQNQLTAEAIRDLRVAIKKLRSYLKLCSGLFKKKDAEKLFEKTRELFSVIGKHRNIETTKGLLLSFAGKDKPVSKSLFIYLQLLQDQVSQYCKEALQQYEKDQ